MTQPVAFTLTARAQLANLEDYIALRTDLATAEKFVRRLVKRCEAIADLPLGGGARPDLGRTFRSVAFKRNTTVVYRVRKEKMVVSGIFYGGQDLSRHYGNRR